jgi:Superinfection immunity protein
MLLMAYFIPTIVAARRLHRNRLAILMLNIFLGWTLIGWVAALVWACTSDVDRPEPVGGRLKSD